MRYFIVFALIILAACNIRAEFTKKKAMAVLTGCKDEAGTSDADFETITKHLPAETKEGKCMIACAYRKFGVMNDDGKIIKDAAIELIKLVIIKIDKKELAAGIHDFCDGLVTSDDHCEAASEYDNCVKLKFDSESIAPAEDLLYLILV